MGYIGSILPGVTAYQVQQLSFADQSIKSAEALLKRPLTPAERANIQSLYSTTTKAIAAATGSKVTEPPAPAPAPKPETSTAPAWLLPAAAGLGLYFLMHKGRR